MNSTQVYTYAKWQVKEGELSNVLDILSEVQRKSIKEKGNLFYKVHQDNADAHILILWEGYANEAALQIHRSSEHFQTLVIGKIVPKLAAREVIVTRQLVMD